MPSHRSRGRAALPATSPPAQERRTAVADRTHCRNRGGQTLDNSARQSLGRSGFNFQILLVPSGHGEGLPRVKEYLTCVKRTPFTEQPTPLRPTPAGSNLHLLTTGEKAKTFLQIVSHPSLRRIRLSAAQAGRRIIREASQAERRRFEFGHPLFTSGLIIVSLGRQSRLARADCI